jgi:hypothetical protein
MGSTSDNAASNILGIGPSSGYILNSSSCISILIFMLCTISVAYNMPWKYVFIPVYVMFLACALPGTFYVTWLYVFDHAFDSYIFYDLAGIYLLPWFDAYNHVNHAYDFGMNIYDAMMLLLIFSYVIIMIQLIFRIKLTWKLSKHLTYPIYVSFRQLDTGDICITRDLLVFFTWRIISPNETMRAWTCFLVLPHSALANNWLLEVVNSV